MRCIRHDGFETRENRHSGDIDTQLRHPRGIDRLQAAASNAWPSPQLTQRRIP